MSEIWANKPGTDEWEPAVPLPLYISRWFGLVKRFGCMCRAEFRSEREYEAHYREVHAAPGLTEEDQ